MAAAWGCEVARVAARALGADKEMQGRYGLLVLLWAAGSLQINVSMAVNAAGNARAAGSTTDDVHNS